jgi:hypothetical protein
LNCSATNLIQAVNGASSGTEILKFSNHFKEDKDYVLKGNFGSEAKMILKVTFSFKAGAALISKIKKEEKSELHNEFSLLSFNKNLILK